MTAYVLQISLDYKLLQLFFSSFVNFAAAYLIEIKFATTRFLILTCRSVINRYNDFDIREQTDRQIII